MHEALSEMTLFHVPFFFFFFTNAKYLKSSKISEIFLLISFKDAFRILSVKCKTMVT